MSNPSAAPPTPEPVLTVSQDKQDIVTVIERFDVPADQQVEAIRKATDHIVQQWKADSAFVGAMLLRSRDRGGVSCYAQWKRAADGSAPTAPATSRSLAATLPNFKLVDSRTYTVEFTAQAESVTSPTRVSLKQTPIAHFGIFDVTGKSQDVMLDRARENAPKSLGTPGLLAINFHRSIDGLQVLNLGAWSTLGGFKALLQRPGFKNQNEYFKNISEFTYDFFDVVAVEVSQ